MVACATRKNEHAAPAASVSASASAAIPEPVAKAFVVDAGPRRIGTCPDGGERRFTLAHVNDLQARYSDRIAGKSRYAFIAGYLRQLKSERPETLVLDAGDDYEKGALAELRSGGEATRRMVQALPIDVRTIGNHDFAYGEDAVMKDVRGSAHPVLAANVRHVSLSGDRQPFRPFVRVDVGCVRVGIVGLVTRAFGADDRQTDEPFAGVFAQDPHTIAVAQREVDAHRSEVDVMIALTHLGFSEDSDLAARVKGLDLVVGGHSENLLEHPAMARHEGGGRTWILQAGRYGEKIGRAEIVVGGDKPGVAIASYRIVNVDTKLPAADDVAALAAEVESAAAPDAHVAIGRVREPVKQGKGMAELVRRAAIAEWQADVVVVGRDLFFAGLDRGEVTLQRLYDAVLVQRQPAGTSGFSSLWSVTLSGDELARLEKAFKPSWRYEIAFPPRIDRAKSYRIVIDKRALLFADAYLGPLAGLKLPAGELRGEMIDLLERYARTRTAARLTID